VPAVPQRGCFLRTEDARAAEGSVCGAGLGAAHPEAAGGEAGCTAASLSLRGALRSGPLRGGWGASRGWPRGGRLRASSRPRAAAAGPGVAPRGKRAGRWPLRRASLLLLGPGSWGLGAAKRPWLGARESPWLLEGAGL